MTKDAILKLLMDVAASRVEPEEALRSLAELPFEDLGFVKMDHHRELRRGVPEAVFAQGKTVEQVAEIIRRQFAAGSPLLVTRVDAEKAALLKACE